MNQTRQLFLHLLSFCFAVTSLSKGYSSEIDEFETNLENLLRNGSILGAQALVGEGDQFLYEKSFGVRSAKDPEPINADTQFCIGSCSKPFAETPTRSPNLLELLAHRGGIYSQKRGMNRR